MATKQKKAKVARKAAPRKAVQKVVARKARRPAVKERKSLLDVVVNAADKTGGADGLKLYVTARSHLRYGVSSHEDRLVIEHRAREARFGEG